MPRKSNSSPSASKRGSSRKKEAEDTVDEPGDESQPTARKRKSSPSTSTRASSKKKKEAEEILEEPEDESQEEEIAPFFLNPKVNPKKVKKASPKTKVKKVEEDPDCRFIGEALPEAEARQRWPKRYQETKPQLTSASNNLDEIEDVLEACCHYTKAEVDGQLFNLYDDAYVKSEDGQPDYICKIVEMFEAVDGSPHFTAQWFYRAKDTVIKDHAYLIDDKRVFFSKIKDDNPLDCLVKRLNIAKVPLNIDTDIKKEFIPICDYYYDMLYLLPYSTFVNVPANAGVEDPNLGVENDSSSTISDNSATDVKADTEEVLKNGVDGKPEMLLLDLYAGCGAMSTGICLGANTSGVKLLTRWAVDINEHACASLKSNHPETEVRNEAAEDFLSLLSEWKKLCAYFSLVSGDSEGVYFNPIEVDDNDNDEESDDDNAADDEVFEVEKILEVCYGDPNAKKEPGLYFKVRWRGYGPDHDTWEPIDGLRDCRERMKEFVVNGYNSKILPLPGDADVICGGPPCQGISGFNRFRNKDNPLDDPKNKQLLVYMNIVEYLKPKYVLMENVVDILKFAEGFIARYALGRLIQMNYQTRMGMMAAGAYGLPQFRMRVFLWGARPTEKLPSYPLPTHDVVKRGVTPLEFEDHVVAYEAGHAIELKERLFLRDAISDLPHVMNGEERDEIPYGQPPQTNFQRFIRRRKDGSLPDVSKPLLFDHRPYKCNEDDYERVCCIPKRKGANFRDLPGVFVRSDNKVEFDPAIPRALVKSGKPLVPDYAMSFTKGTSSKPFARLWWDETVPTVVTRPEPHNQKIIHPEQDRVLSIRENARLQGFPDYYKLYGPVKQRYMQVGNAVAVPVARALGYALGMACQGSVGDEAVFSLPSDFTR